MPKQITNEALAAMVQRGFEPAATKQNLERFATREDIKGLRTLTEVVAADLKLVRADVRDLIHGCVAELADRLERVEKKLGLVK